MTHSRTDGNGWQDISDFPSDVLNAASEAVDAMPARPPFKFDVELAIAKAILSERERCVAEMDNFIDNVTVSIDGRSRFDIYDLNRECKKSVRYVRDRLNGQFDKYWAEEPLPKPPVSQPKAEGESE